MLKRKELAETLFDWTSPYIGNPTLLEILRDQWQYLIALAHRIW